MTQPQLLELTETDYLQMEEALLASSRGRAFLRMRDRRTRSVAVDDFRRIAEKLEKQVDRLNGAAPAPAPAPAAISGGLQQEILALTQHVQQTRSDIAALRPVDSGANRIEAATGELDAIVAATERATTDILNAAERIQEWTARMPRDNDDMAEIADAIEAWCIEILTACSFQDITGQRTTKVVNTLKYIEQRVNTMIEIWGVDKTISMAEMAGGGFTASHRKLNDERPDAHLLNGPSLGDGIDQNAIDSLFDSFGGDMGGGDMGGMLDRVEAAPAAMSAPASSPPPTQVVKQAAPKPAAPPKPAASGGGGDGFSQSDIDKLFA
jgi:chemotaxis regulatin CheY-phosphate phosphatase CheZ